MSDDGLGLLLLLGVPLALAGGIIFVLYKGVSWGLRADDTRGIQSQAQVACEETAAELIQKHPEENDSQLALRMRDELVTAQSRNQFLYQWATPETVARVRRLTTRQ